MMNKRKGMNGQKGLFDPKPLWDPTKPLDYKGTDPTAGYHRGNEESREAWDSLPEETVTGQLGVVVDTIRKSKGLTCDEVEIITGLSHQTVSARITILKQRGWLDVIGKRPTRTGRMASVYRVIE